MSDGNLRSLFQKHLPDIHWQPIETWSTGQGVPDVNGCCGGREFWIENKATGGWTIHFEPGQVAWAERRVRAGGRTFVAVRRQANAGPRRGQAVDELWLFNGESARALALNGLKAGPRPLVQTSGGPARWDWPKIRQLLLA